jgi:ribonucleotide reductase beta subunit family protein with ferritin-like domain
MFINVFLEGKFCFEHTPLRGVCSSVRVLLANARRRGQVDLAHDMKDWESLSDGERHFVITVLAFFAASDGIVNENLAVNFYDEVELPEARCFYGFQIAIENIHSEMYSLLIDTYVRDTQQKEKLFNAITEIPCVRNKAEWAFSYMNPKSASFATRLIAFAVVEGKALNKFLELRE